MLPDCQFRGLANCRRRRGRSVGRRRIHRSARDAGCARPIVNRVGISRRLRNAHDVPAIGCIASAHPFQPALPATPPGRRYFKRWINDQVPARDRSAGALDHGKPRCGDDSQENRENSRRMSRQSWVPIRGTRKPAKESRRASPATQEAMRRLVRGRSMVSVVFRTASMKRCVDVVALSLRMSSV